MSSLPVCRERRAPCSSSGPVRRRRGFLEVLCREDHRAHPRKTLRLGGRFRRAFRGDRREHKPRLTGAVAHGQPRWPPGWHEWPVPRLAPPTDKVPRDDILADTMRAVTARRLNDRAHFKRSIHQLKCFLERTTGLSRIAFRYGKEEAVECRNAREVGTCLSDRSAAGTRAAPLSGACCGQAWSSA